MSTTTQTNSGNSQQTAVAAATADAMQKNDPSEAINRLSQLPDPIVQSQETTFTFKKPRKGADGKPVTDELGQEVTARAPVKLMIPVPTWEGLLSFLGEDEKHQTFLLDVVADLIKEEAKKQVNDETKPVNTQEQLNLDLLSLKYIANMPKSERTGRGIAKEIWEEWTKDYVSTITAATGRDVEKATIAAKLFYPGRLQPVKTNKKVISFLANQLDIWMSNTANGEEYQEIYDFLKKKADEFIQMDEATLLENLQ